MLPTREAWMMLVLTAVGTETQSVAAQVDARGLREAVEAFMNAADLHGAALAVVRPGAEPWSMAFGDDASGRRLTADHTFHLGAATEVLTAAAAVRLASEGRIGLDTSVLEYLPTLQLGPADRASTLTVRHLLKHTSGLSTLSGFNRRAQAEGRFEFMRLVHDPGSRREASAANFILLGRVLESVTGQGYSRLLDEELLLPLQMLHSNVASGGGEAASQVRGYGLVGGLQIRRSAPLFGPITLPALGARSSSRDLATLLRQLVPDPPRSAPADAESRAGASDVAGLTFASAVEPGFAWQETRFGGRRAYRARGAVPGQTTELIIFPDEGVGVALLVNRTRAFVAPASEALLHTVVETLRAAAPSPYRNIDRWMGVAVGLGLLAILIRAATLLRSWYRLDRPRAVAHTRPVVLRLLADVAVAGALPLIVLLGLLKMSFPAAVAMYPDLAIALVVFPILTAPAAVLRSVVSSERWRRDKAAG